MVADFSKPLHTQSSDTIVDQLRDNIVQVSKLDYTGASNVPVGAFAYDNGLFKRKQNDGTWATLPVTLSASGNLTLDLLSAKAITVANSALGTSVVQINPTGIVSDGAIESKDELIAPNIEALREDVDELMSTTSVFATGTSGTDFNIAQSTSGITKTTTFNIPDAAVGARGVITTTNQTLSGEKTFTSLLVVDPGRIQLGKHSTATNNWNITSEGANGKLLFSNGNYGSASTKATLTDNGLLGLGTESPQAPLHVSGRVLNRIMVTGQSVDGGQSPSSSLILNTLDSSGNYIAEASLALYTNELSVSNDSGSIEVSTNDSIYLRTGPEQLLRARISYTGEATFGDILGAATASVQIEAGVSSGSAPSSEKGRASHNTTLRLTKGSTTTTNNTLLFQTSGPNHLITLARQGTTAGTLAVGTESTDDVILHTNKLTRVIVNGTSGNVGVGLTSPQEVAHIKGKLIVADEDTIPTLSGGLVSPVATADRGRVSIITNGQNADILLFNKVASVSGRSARIGLNNSLSDNPLVVVSNSSIQFRTTSSSTATVALSSGTTQMLLSNEGNLGLGTTSPSEKLDVLGVLKLQATSAPIWDTATRFWTESGFGARYDGYSHRFDVGNTRTEALRITNSGNVGIGGAPRAANILLDGQRTSDGDLFFAIRNSSSGTKANAGLLLGNDSNQYGAQLRYYSSTSEYAAANTFSIANSAAGPITLGTNGTTRLTVQSDGIIDVPGMIKTSSGLRVLNVSTAQWQLGPFYNTTDFHITHSATSFTSHTGHLTITTGGNVGIGTTSPTAKLHVNGGVEVNGEMIVKSSDYSTLWMWDTNERMAGLHCNGGHFYLLRTAGANTTAAETYNGRYPLQIRLSDNTTYLGGSLDVLGTITTNNNAITCGSITSTGIVKVIGAANSDSGTLGSTNGSTLYVASQNGLHGVMFGVAADGDGYIQAQRSDGNAATYNLNLQPSGGCVGIGTVSADNTLDIQESNPSRAPIRIAQTTSGSNGTYCINMQKQGTAASGATLNFIAFRGQLGGQNLGGIASINGAVAGLLASSDRRLKKNIENLSTQLEHFLSLRPVEFEYTHSPDIKQVGFVAQEVQEVYPDLVGEDENQHLFLVGLSKTDARVIKVIQELHEKIITLEARVTELESKE
jgi:Chaperone of endosialidase